MYTIKIQDRTIVPVDFNIFYDTAKVYKKNIRYSREYTITENFFEELFCYISNTSDDKVFIDMENIVSYPTRLFSRLQKYIDKIVIYNLNNKKIRQMLREDLERLYWTDDELVAFGNGKEHDIKEELNKYCSESRQKEKIRIVKGIVSCREKADQLLASSGLYSNCYVDVKKLFYSVDGYYYIIFSLAQEIHNNISKMQIDAFVSSSKNGAIIANILGGLLDIKEVHLIGVGPKYSMELGDSVECIKKGKKYAYIFDFMCTGTELKIVSTLINSKKAYLPYAIGIARYRRKMKSCVVESIDVLVDTEEMNIDYRIVGKSDNLI